jgi:hypothetical protein
MQTFDKETNLNALNRQRSPAKGVTVELPEIKKA